MKKLLQNHHRDTIGRREVLGRGRKHYRKIRQQSKDVSLILDISELGQRCLKVYGIAGTEVKFGRGSKMVIRSNGYTSHLHSNFLGCILNRDDFGFAKSRHKFCIFLSEQVFAMLRQRYHITHYIIQDCVRVEKDIKK